MLVTRMCEYHNLYTGSAYTFEHMHARARVSVREHVFAHTRHIGVSVCTMHESMWQHSKHLHLLM